MKKVLDNNIKKITVGLLVLLVVALVIYIFLIFSSKSKIKEYSNNLYILQYDDSWSVHSSTSNSTELKHSNNAIININVKELEEPYKYETLDTLLDDIIYGIGKQNSNYVMLGQEEAKLTKNKLDGYKLLYEHDNRQVLVVVIKQSDKLVTFTYEAEFDYFDILLDSAQNILYNFEFQKEEMEYDNKLDSIETTTLNIGGDTKVGKTVEHEISRTHYTVRYTIPEEFTIHDFNSSYGYYYEKDKNSDKDITIYTSISNSNVYEVITEEYFGVEKEIEDLKEDENNKNLRVQVGKGSENDSYIYYITYNRESSFLDKVTITEKQLVYILIPLDNSHTFKIEIKAENGGISKALLDSIKIVKKEKYSENVVFNYEGNEAVNELRKLNSSYDKYLSIMLYTPKKYRELDHDNNKYDSRYFGYDYDEENSEYMTTIYYSLNSFETTLEDVIDDYDTYEGAKVVSDGSKVYNGRTYNVFNVSYKLNNVTMYEKKLYTKLDDKTYLEIEISGEQNYFNDTMLNELTKFKTETKDYN